MCSWTTQRHGMRRDDGMKFVLQIKNSGATPAHKVLVRAGTFCVDHPYNGPFPLPNELNSFVLPPGSSAPHNVTIVLHPAEKRSEILEKIDKGQMIIYIYGRIDYVDIFRRKQWSEFRSEIGGNNTRKLTISDAGNNASK